MRSQGLSIEAGLYCVKALWGRFGILCWVKLSWLGVRLILSFSFGWEGGGSEAKQRKSSPKWNERWFIQGGRKQKRHFSFRFPSLLEKNGILFWFVYVTGDAGSCHCLRMLFRYESPFRIRSPPTTLPHFHFCLSDSKAEWEPPVRSSKWLVSSQIKHCSRCGTQAELFLNFLCANTLCFSKFESILSRVSKNIVTIRRRPAVW